MVDHFGEALAKSGPLIDYDERLVRHELDGAWHRALISRRFVSSRGGCPPADGYHTPILAPGTAQARDPGVFDYGGLLPIQCCGR
jgi:hypothetical protein